MSKSQSQTIMPPEGCQAALFFLDGQYLFTYDGDGAVHSKFVSPAAVRQAFAGEPVDSGWLPEGVIRWGSGSRGTWMVRYHAPAVYRVIIEGERSFRVPMPPLIWFGQKTHYYIWAVKGKSFDPKAQLYRAPLPNVNLNGLICFGKNAHPDVAKGGFDKTWRTFWEAPFNGDHANTKSHAHKKDVREQLRAVAKSKEKTYPSTDLVRMGHTVESAIEMHTRRDDGYDDDDE